VNADLVFGNITFDKTANTKGGDIKYHYSVVLQLVWTEVENGGGYMMFWMIKEDDLLSSSY